MANKKNSLDFSRMFQDILTYFRDLKTDMILAWSALVVGIIILIVALTL
jgi:hypothetical protein